MNPEACAKLTDLLRDVSVAMLTTTAEDGSLRSRPMGIPQYEFEGELWFFTAVDAPKAGELTEDERVNVSLAEPKHERYVSISGRARVVRDPAKAKELWSPLLKAWFPGGLDDPRIALLRIAVDQAEYWDAKGSKMPVFASFVKAAVTGTSPDHLGKHKKLA
jgi:general stress protein 26